MARELRSYERRVGGSAVLECGECLALVWLDNERADWREHVEWHNKFEIVCDLIEILIANTDAPERMSSEAKEIVVEFGRMRGHINASF